MLFHFDSTNYKNYKTFSSKTNTSEEFFKEFIHSKYVIIFLHLSFKGKSITVSWGHEHSSGEKLVCFGRLPDTSTETKDNVYYSATLIGAPQGTLVSNCTVLTCMEWSMDGRVWSDFVGSDQFSVGKLFGLVHWCWDCVPYYLTWFNCNQELDTLWWNQ